MSPLRQLPVFVLLLANGGLGQVNTPDTATGLPGTVATPITPTDGQICPLISLCPPITATPGQLPSPITWWTSADSSPCSPPVTSGSAASGPITIPGSPPLVTNCDYLVGCYETTTTLPQPKVTLTGVPIPCPSGSTICPAVGTASGTALLTSGVGSGSAEKSSTSQAGISQLLKTLTYRSGCKFTW